jgi:hypothetical protein
LLASQAYAGPLILAGHDADDHGIVAAYADLFDAIQANVTNGQTGILAIGADPPPSEAGDWITTVNNAMAVPQGVTYVNGAGNIAAVDLSTYAIIFVPSTEVDTPDGGITIAENDALIARAVDIASFVNTGGGLFGLTQDSVANAYGYLGLFAGITAQGVPSTGVCDGGAAGETYDDVTPTAEGSALGITTGNVDGCCWHNTFTAFAPFFNILATANEPGCPSIDGQPSVIGCLDCRIPGQMSLTPLIDLNPLGTNHTVTATFLEPVAPNDPIQGVLITFEVLSGPNAGDMGTDTTDVNGEATFTYTGDGGAGVDVIQASGMDPVSLEVVSSTEVLKFWDADCNTNDIPDTCDVDCAGFGGECAEYVGCGGSADVNMDNVPDECAVCGNNVIEPGEECDDGGTANGDCLRAEYGVVRRQQ